jgi:hypothetical protein
VVAERTPVRETPIRPWFMNNFSTPFSRSQYNPPCLDRFPTPTNIQQRYCYPKGRLEYSSRKGGALWTMCDEFGKEDTEYRLLHVYLSPKRAANKGVDLSQEEKDLVYQRQQQAAASVAAASEAAGAAATSPRSKKARYGRKPTTIHRRTQDLKQTPGKTSRYRGFNHKPSSSAHVMVSTSTSTASPPHYGSAMLVSSPPSLSPLSFDRFPTASSLSPSSPMYSDPYGPSGLRQGPQFRLDKYNPPHHPGPADVSHTFDTSYPHAFSRDRTAPFVTPLHGSRRHNDPYSHHRSSTDEYESHSYYQASASYQSHTDSGQLYEASQCHRRDKRQLHNLEQSPLRRRESFLDDPRADPFWDGHDPDDEAGRDGNDGKSVHYASTEHEGATSNGPTLAASLSLPSDTGYDRGWQRRREEASPTGNANKASESTIFKSEGSEEGSLSGDPFGTHAVLQPDNAPFEAPSSQRILDNSRSSCSRYHRRSSSASSSYSQSAAAATIGVARDRAAPNLASSPSRALARRLVAVQRTLRDAVLSQAPEVRGKLVSMVVSWAAQLKLDPLAVLADGAEYGGRGAPTASVDDNGAHQVGASVNEQFVSSAFIPTNTLSPATASRDRSANHQSSEISSASIRGPADEQIDQAMSVAEV